MSYLVKRAGIGIGNIVSMLIWEGLLFSMAIISTVSQNNISEIPEAQSIFEMNKKLMVKGIRKSYIKPLC